MDVSLVSKKPLRAVCGYRVQDKDALGFVASDKGHLLLGAASLSIPRAGVKAVSWAKERGKEVSRGQCAIWPGIMMASVYRYEQGEDVHGGLTSFYWLVRFDGRLEVAQVRRQVIRGRSCLTLIILF